MINPLKRVQLKGFLWYQGEANFAYNRNNHYTQAVHWIPYCGSFYAFIINVSSGFPLTMQINFRIVFLNFCVVKWTLLPVSIFCLYRMTICSSFRCKLREFTMGRAQNFCEIFCDFLKIYLPGSQLGTLGLSIEPPFLELLWIFNRWPLFLKAVLETFTVPKAMGDFIVNREMYSS
jgi:hypothetical protein